MGFTSASRVRNGVMTPGVSAGSNHVGASVTVAANVTCPSGAATAGAHIAGARGTNRPSTTPKASDEWGGFTAPVPSFRERTSSPPSPQAAYTDVAFYNRTA